VYLENDHDAFGVADDGGGSGRADRRGDGDETAPDGRRARAEGAASVTMLAPATPVAPAPVETKPVETKPVETPAPAPVVAAPAPALVVEPTPAVTPAPSTDGRNAAGVELISTRNAKRTRNRCRSALRVPRRV